jgi:hypothetical protein
MATLRFYLTNAAASFTPTTIRGTWNDATNAGVHRLGPAPSGAAATGAGTLATATNNYDVLVHRWVSDPITVAGTFPASGTSISYTFGRLESSASANLVTKTHLWITQGDTDVVRGSAVIFNRVGSTNWPTTAASLTHATGIDSTVACQVGDRIVLELGFEKLNVTATSFTGTVNYGNTGTPDLGNADTNVTTRPAWLECDMSALFALATVSVSDTPRAALAVVAAQTLQVGRVVSTGPGSALLFNTAQVTAVGRALADRAGSATAGAPGQTLVVDRLVVDRPGEATAASVSQALTVGRALADRPTSVLGSTSTTVLVTDQIRSDRPIPALAGGPLGEQISAVTPVVVVDRSSAVIAVSRGQSLVVDRLLTDAPSAIRASSPASSLAVDRFVTDRSSAIRTGGGAQQVVVGVAAVDRSGATAAAGPSQALVTDRLLADRPGSVAAGAPGQTGQVDTVRTDRPGSMSATRPGQVVLVDVIRQDRPGPATAAGPATGLVLDVAASDRPWQVLAASCGQRIVRGAPAPTAGWPPVFAGPELAPLVLVSGPELAPLALVGAVASAPLVLISGHVPAPSPGSTPHPVMARRGLARRSLPGPADEFVIEEFRRLRERRRAAKIRGANQ